jgi:hypothetical protein
VQIATKRIAMPKNSAAKANLNSMMLAAQATVLLSSNFKL